MVKKKLEARQLAAERKVDPNEEINPSRYKDDRKKGGGKSNSGFYTYQELLGGPNNRFTGEGDLSSRTPFARMWTAVQLVEKIDYENHPDYEILLEVPKSGDGRKDRQAAHAYAKRAAEGDPADPSKPDPTIKKFFPRAAVFYDAKKEQWSDELLKLFKINKSLLPEVKENSFNFGITNIFG